MSPPHIPKIGATTVPPATNGRAGGSGNSASQRQQAAPVAPQAPTPAETAVVVNRSLELLETMAGQVSEATGENLDVSRPAEGDSAYRVQLMSFIVGSLSRASQAFRQRAAQAEPEPEPAEEEEAAVEEAEVEAALPEAPVGDPVEAAAEVEAQVGLPNEPDPGQEATSYGSKGQAVNEGGQKANVEKWA